MSPEETHIKILKQIDDAEFDMYRLYCKVTRLRLSLQAQWRVLPSGARWTIERQIEDEKAVR